MTDSLVEVVEPRREVVEVVETGERVLYIVEPTVPPSVPRVLADLDDVAADPPTTGQALAWTGTEWAPTSVASAGGLDLAEIEGRVAVLEARPVVDSPDDVGAQPADADLTTIAGLAPADGSVLARVAGAWSSRTGAQLKADLGVVIGDVTGLQAALDAKQPVGNYADAGHTHAEPAPVTLVDQANITTDVSQGRKFRVTLGGSRTLVAPSNPVDGMRCTWMFTQDATGGRTITLAGGAGGFAFGSDVPSFVLSTGAGKTDVLGAEYHAGRDRWLVLATTKGF